MKHVFLLLALLVLSACTATQPLPESPSTQLKPPAYRLMAGDVIEIQITQRQDLSGEYTLGPDGSLFLQEIGRIPVSGLEQEEAEARILVALQELYSPVSVSLRIKRFQGSEFVVILGEVEQPGKYPIQNQLSLIQLIGEASGFTRDADLSRIQLVREDGTIEPIRINLKKLISNGDLKQNLVLLKGDLVVVPRRPLRIGFSSLNELLPLAQLLLLVLVTYNQAN
jgi:polysaccharide export outer membrane protein